jgi:hypothetical protein
MVSSCGLRTFAGRCLLRRQFLCQLVSTHGVLMRLPGEFVSGQMISLGTGDSGGVGVHDQVLRLVVCACSVVSCRPYRGRSHNLSSKRAPCYDDSDCRNCSKLHTDKKSVPRLSMLLHLCVAAPANLSRSAIAKQFVTVADLSSRCGFVREVLKRDATVMIQTGVKRIHFPAVFILEESSHGHGPRGHEHWQYLQRRSA